MKEGDNLGKLSLEESGIVYRKTIYGPVTDHISQQRRLRWVCTDLPEPSLFVYSKYGCMGESSINYSTPTRMFLFKYS